MQSVQPRQAAHCTLVTVYTRVKGKLRYLALRIGGPDSPRCPAAALPSVHYVVYLDTGHSTPSQPCRRPHWLSAAHCTVHTVHTVLRCTALYCAHVPGDPGTNTHNTTPIPRPTPGYMSQRRCCQWVEGGGWWPPKQVLSAGSAWSVML